MLPDAAEWPEEIDLERAQAAKERALKRIEDRHQDEVNMERAQAALARALMRIEMKQH
jgi:F-type H+-transporting ATPase subunit epsilon